MDIDVSLKDPTTTERGAWLWHPGDPAVRQRAAVAAAVAGDGPLLDLGGDGAAASLLATAGVAVRVAVPNATAAEREQLAGGAHIEPVVGDPATLLGGDESRQAAAIAWLAGLESRPDRAALAAQMGALAAAGTPVVLALALRAPTGRANDATSAPATLEREEAAALLDAAGASVRLEQRRVEGAALRDLAGASARLATTVEDAAGPAPTHLVGVARADAAGMAGALLVVEAVEAGALERARAATAALEAANAPLARAADPTSASLAPTGPPGARLVVELEQARQRAAEAERELMDAERRIADSAVAASAAAARHERDAETIAALKASVSWRATAPLRSLAARLRRR